MKAKLRARCYDDSHTNLGLPAATAPPDPVGAVDPPGRPRSCSRKEGSSVATWVRAILRLLVDAESSCSVGGLVELLFSSMGWADRWLELIVTAGCCSLRSLLSRIVNVVGGRWITTRLWGVLRPVELTKVKY